ncbi:MAG TPA: CHAT domain-containing tetratricopeptide repeat protein, partial [Pyrinomonadaceae bacterium]|nr:CHAT domain-containing tetratricopeptide repeat protein [Pyrinomonadaceae bacterium]
EALPAPEQAKQAWREYLELDSSSKWAEEARQHLQALESKKTEDRSAAELEHDFLVAVREKNEEKAWQLLSRNRELIREKYLPQRLAMSFLEASGDERKDFLVALEYAGELEKTRIGDPFASEIAQFYVNLPENKINLLKQAQQAVRDSYKLSLENKFGDALNKSIISFDLFLQVGDIWESKLTEYFISYCLINTERVNEGIIRLEKIIGFSQNQNYRWLEVTSLYWLAGAFLKVGQHTKAKRFYEKALLSAEKIEDSYAIQRNLLVLANLSSFVGQKRQALNYLHGVLERMSNSKTSLRQKYRNFSDAHQVLTLAKLYNAAKSIALESMQSADEYKQDEMFIVLSRNNAGIAHFLTGNFNMARDLLSEGQKKAETILDKGSREKMLAYCFLNFGYLERKAGNYEKSEQFYKEALKLYKTMQMPFYEYEAQKGKLLTYLALGRNIELDEQIPVTLKLIENYRKEILEEQEKISFFDNEESIYDIAADYEYGRGRYEQAYNYTEISNSRSLLDWLQKGAKFLGKKQKLKVLLEENATPITLTEIRERMPEQVQILQFSVLENKVLIWLVSKDKFIVVPASVRSNELREKVENYVDLLKRNDEVAQENAQRIARELYDLLISPIFNYLDPAKKICLIPSKVLFYLPFAALISPEEKPFLAEFDFFYAPSANVFLICTENAQRKANLVNEALLSIGNPAFDDQFLDKLADLPEAENEAREIKVFYNNNNRKIFVGKEATKTAFMNSLKDAHIIHFAGHYVVVHDTPLSSYLVLAQNGEEIEDSILANSELVDEKLPQAKLVILSACQTGVEHYYNGEGLIGLSRTFLAAGAPLVVASQWSVETEATAKLMKRFHFFRKQEKMSTTAALRSAQLEMLNEPNGRFRTPYYWAAFAAFGGYASF